MASEIIIQLNLDDKKAVEKINASSRQFMKAGEKSGESFRKGAEKEINKINLKSLSASLGSLIGPIGAATAAFTAFSAVVIKSTVSATSGIEKIATGLEVLTGSAIKANNVLSDLSDFASTTPFQLENIAQASQSLLSFGFSADTIIDRIKKIGEVAAGSNSDLKEVALIYGQVSAAGKLTGERLLQLQERAIPIGRALAKSLQVPRSEVRKLVSEGKVGFAEFERAFNSLSEEGGLFEGAITKQSKTIAGSFSTLSDNISLAGAEIGKIFAPAVVEAAKTFTGILVTFTKEIKDDLPILANNFSKIAKTLLIEPATFWSNLFLDGPSNNLAETTKRIKELKIRSDELQATLEKQQRIEESQPFRNFSRGANELKIELADVLTEMAELQALLPQLQPEPIDPDTVLNNLGFPTGEQLANLYSDLADAQATLQQALFIPEGGEENKVDIQLQEMANNVANSQLQIQSDNLALGASFETTAQTIVKASKQISSAIKAGLVKAVSGGIQQLTKNLLEGKSLFDNFGKFVLGVLGDMAIQIGTTSIAAGITITALTGLQGAKAVAAGAGLVAIGTVLKSLSGGQGGIGATPSSQTVGGAPQGGFENDLVLDAEEEEERVPETNVVVNIQGDVFDSDQSGSRIVNIINDAFDKQGITIRQGALS